MKSCLFYQGPVEVQPSMADAAARPSMADAAARQSMADAAVRPSGTQARLLSDPAKLGRVTGVSRGWRCVTYENCGKKNHRPRALEEVGPDESHSVKPRCQLRGKQPLTHATAVVVMMKVSSHLHFDFDNN